jgi:hypothetical protein
VPVPVLEPLELPEPMPLPEPLLDPVPGVAGLLGDVELEPLLPPLVPPAAPEPDLLKWASHSERDTWPSLFVSTAEKLGCEPLVEAPPAAELPVLEDAPEEPLELAPDAAGEDDDLSLLAPLDEPPAARDTLDNANSAAAVATLSTLSFNIAWFLLRRKNGENCVQGCSKTRAPTGNQPA